MTALGQADHPLGLRPPAFSHTVVTRNIVYEDLNGARRLFGGRLMEWIDEAAGICSRRHCGMQVTTASVDTLTFKRPAHLNDIVIIEADVTYVGRTSLEVRVLSFVEDLPTGERSLMNKAYLTEVCVDDTGHPTVVPWGLELTSDVERQEFEDAKKRIVFRKTREGEGF